MRFSNKLLKYKDERLPKLPLYNSWLELHRRSVNGKDVLGELYIKEHGGKDRLFSNTLETSVLDYRRGFNGLVPPGEYPVFMNTRLNGSRQAFLQEERHRGIYFHSGGSSDDVKGCIILFRSFDVVDGRIVCHDSRKVCKEFYDYVEKASGLLSIKIHKIGDKNEMGN